MKVFKMIIKNSMFACLITVALCLTVLAKGNNDEITPLSQPEAYQQRLVDWIRSGENGFFHPSVVWKRLGPDGSYAMHATKDISKDEILLVVPRSHTIDSFKTHNHCVTVARLLHEYEKGDDSFYAPYLSYLFDDGGTSTGLLPTSWSEDGQEILAYMLGHTDDEGEYYEEAEGLEPEYFEQASVFDDCGESFRGQTVNHPLEDEELRQQIEDAYLFWLSRSFGGKIIPVLDMYNHGNGVSKNVESTSTYLSDNDITAYALRDIQAGEQLQNSYSECMDEDCSWGGIQYSYLTQAIFVDYGFLEYYPRRWKIGEKSEVIAEIYLNKMDGQKSFHWIFSTPSEETIQWISNQLQRLQELNDEFRMEVSDHKTTSVDDVASHHNIEHEANTLLEFYEGYIEVLEMALEHKDDPIGVTQQQFNKELKKAREESQYDEL